jgi:hypothetical protein
MPTDQELLVRFTLLVRRVSDCLTELKALKGAIEDRLLEPTAGAAPEPPRNEVVCVQPEPKVPAASATRAPRDFQAWLKAAGFQDGHKFLHRKTETPLTLEWGVKKKEAYLINTELNVRESTLSGVVGKVAKICGISGGSGWNRQLMAEGRDGEMHLIEDEDFWGLKWNADYGVWEQLGKPPLRPKTAPAFPSEPVKKMSPLLALREAKDKMKVLEAEYNRADGSDPRRVRELESQMDVTEKEIAVLQRIEAQCGECHQSVAGVDHRWCILNGHNGGLRAWESECY